MTEPRGEYRLKMMSSRAARTARRITRTVLLASLLATRLLATRLGAATFFQQSYARDFITMSARPPGRTSRA